MLFTCTAAARAQAAGPARLQKEPVVALLVCVFPEVRNKNTVKRAT